MQKASLGLVENTHSHSMCQKTERGLQVQSLHLDRSKALRVNSSHGRSKFGQS